MACASTRCPRSRSGSAQAVDEREPVRRLAQIGLLVMRELVASRADVWLFDMGTDVFRRHAEDGPTAEEDRSQAAEITDEDRKARLLARRALTRRVLATYLSRSAASIRFVKVPGGKPAMLPDAEDAIPLAFSTAHTKDLFCIGVSGAASVGVDVEWVRDVGRWERIAERWYFDAEQASIRDADDGAEEFLRIWTGKEALAKRHSAGLRLLYRRDQEALDVVGEREAGCLADFDAGADFTGAVASTESIASVEVLRDAYEALSD